MDKVCLAIRPAWEKIHGVVENHGFPIHWSHLDEAQNFIEARDGNLPRRERVVTDSKNGEARLATVSHTPPPINLLSMGTEVVGPCPG